MFQEHHYTDETKNKKQFQFNYTLLIFITE